MANTFTLTLTLPKNSPQSEAHLWSWISDQKLYRGPNGDYHPSDIRRRGTRWTITFNHSWTLAEQMDYLEHGAADYDLGDYLQTLTQTGGEFGKRRGYRLQIPVPH